MDTEQNGTVMTFGRGLMDGTGTIRNYSASGLRYASTGMSMRDCRLREIRDGESSLCYFVVPVHKLPINVASKKTFT
jgi:hypothetical protein